MFNKKKLFLRYFIIPVVLSYIVILYSCSSDYIKNLGSGYFYRDEGGDTVDILCEKPEGGEVPATVISYDYNRKFIIAKQKPRLPQDILYQKEYNYNRGGDAIYYWLIIKSEHLVLGPLDEEEFIVARSKYNVPDDLDLD